MSAQSKQTWLSFFADDDAITDFTKAVRETELDQEYTHKVKLAEKQRVEQYYPHDKMFWFSLVSPEKFRRHRVKNYWRVESFLLNG